jgi:hypothetical protein
MNPLDDFFSKKNILNYLCRQRAKKAKRRNEIHLLSRISKRKKYYKYHKKVKNENNNSNEICSIMPPRRLWVNPSKKNRYNNKDKLNSIEKNKKAIFLTIQKHRKSNMEFRYLKRLDQFISDIGKAINDKYFSFSPPKIKPELKERNGNTCRPISSFSLKDNIIICITNKYLTQYFDDLFYVDSYAFRSAKQFKDEKRAPCHHDAFQRIIDYLLENKGKTIYVAECDMKKFYDTVDHKIVLRQFKILCLKNMFKLKGWCDNRAQRIFRQYLECYNFHDNVFNKNSDSEYFRKYNIDNGKFEWVDELIGNLDGNRYYADIGIPQGGALSGLIANIVLDYADKKVLQTKDEDILYLRYCDDMIMMHTDKLKCKEALNKYMSALEKLKLFPYPLKKEKYSRTFWSSKSKGPYIWDDDEIPWVGFVGYEINRKGEIRVRKKSLKKERNKQKELVENIMVAISDDNIKVSVSEVIESTEKRLVGMAVGRVNLWNYKSYKNDLCWAKGFNLLNDNKYSRMQVKSLDRSRNKYLRRLRIFLDSFEQDKERAVSERSNKQITFLGKPFSYYYHVIEKGRIR